MGLARLPHIGLAARLTALNAAIVALAATGVVLLIVTLADRYMRDHVDESVGAELQVLVADYHIDGLPGVRGFIDIREDFVTENHGRTYRLEDAQGRRLAGGWPDWPPGLDTDGRILRLPNPSRSPPTEWFMAAARLPDGSRVLVGFDSIEHRAVMEDVHRAAGIGLLLAFVLAVIVGALANRAALRPIATIRRSAERIIDGELLHRIPQRGSGDEFDALTQTLNRMLDRIHTLIEGLRSATDAIAHDLRSPLARHRTRLEAALQNPPDAAVLPQWLQDNIVEVDRVLGTFSALLQLATVESGAQTRTFRPLALDVLAADAASLYEAEAAERGMALQLIVDGKDLMVNGDRNLMFQSVINLLDNAIKYGPPGQTIVLSLHADGTRIHLSVIDQGPGIAAPEQARVFDRMVRGDQARRTPGHGLGLSLVRAVARLHGGSVEVVASGQGAHLQLSLPRA